MSTQSGKKSNVRRFGVIELTACLVLGLAIGAIVGRTLLAKQDNVSTAASPTAAESSVPSLPGASPTTANPDVATLLAAADAANPSGGSTQERAGARMTVSDTGAGIQTVVIRDEINANKPAGQYRFVVVCAGTGKVWADIRVGDRDEGGVVACGVPVSPVAFQVATANQSSSGTVTVVPLNSTQAAVAYSISHLA